MNWKSIAIAVFRLLLISISIYNLRNYIEIRDIVSSKQPDKYKVVDKKIRRGNGRHFDMTVEYDSKLYKISITRKEYYSLEEKVYPALYYSDAHDTLYSKWEGKVFFRIFIMFVIGFMLTFIPRRYLETKPDS